jgi:hypothetical protein
MKNLLVKGRRRGGVGIDPPETASCHSSAGQRAEADQHAAAVFAAFRGGKRGVSGWRGKLDRDGLPACHRWGWCLECRWPPDAGR